MYGYEIAGYQVYSVRWGHGSLGQTLQGAWPEHGVGWIRQIRMEFRPGQRQLAPGTVAYVAFLEDELWDKEAVRSGGVVGQWAAVGRFERLGEPPHLVAFMPLRDFADVYHILQSERPVYVEFELFAPPIRDIFMLAWFAIRSGREETGEGPEDTSIVRAVDPIARALRELGFTVEAPGGVRE